MDVRCLIVEDDADDATLCVRRLEGSGLRVESSMVSDERSLRSALAGAAWDVALVDYNLPGFGGMEAIAVLRREAPDLPIITVSGIIDEDTAVTTLRAGAVDYVLKGNLTRLGPAVIRAMEEAELRCDERLAEERLVATLEVTGIGLWDWDVRHDIWTASSQYYTMLGYRPVEGPSDRGVWLQRVHPDDREYVAGKIAAVLQGDASHYEYEARMLHADGGYRWHRVVGHLVERDAQGSPVRLVGVRMDVDEHRRAVDALRRSEAQLRTLIDTLPDLVWLKDLDGVYVSCNRRFGQFFGASSEQIVGKTDYDFTEASVADSFRDRDRMAVAAGGPTANEEEIAFASDGHRELLETIKTPVFASDGRPIGVLGVGRDITERKRSEEALRRQAEQLRRTVDGAVRAMSNIVESRDPYTAGHEHRVAQLATAIAEEMGVAGASLEALRWAGLIHDVGKVGVPAEILSKPGRLSQVEFNLIKQHPLAGCEMVGAIDFGGPVAQIIRQHHERIDGSGYPDGITGDEMLQEAKILAVADVVEAISSHRPYRAALGIDAALEEIEAHSGTLYAPEVVAACVRTIREKGFEYTA